MKKLLKKDDLFMCEECQKSFRNKLGLSTHIFAKHKPVIYHEKYVKEKDDDICKICNYPTSFISVTRGYHNCCSKKCTNEYTKLQTINSMKEKYGVENASNLEFVKNKIGAKNRIHSEKSKIKRRQTLLHKYGVDNPMKVKEIKDNLIKTFLKKYGVENPQQLEKIHKKTLKSGFKIKKYDDTDIYYQGSYELDFLKKYYHKFDDLKRGPKIKYSYKNHSHYYFPDFFIPSLNLIIEIKSNYWLKKHLARNNAKKEATIKEGINYLLLMDKNYTHFDSMIR